jgi:hypothetical protein
MMNKTKRNEVEKRNESAVANRRPKRCYLCKKTYAYDKYVSRIKNRMNISRRAIVFRTKKSNKAEQRQILKQIPTKMLVSLSTTRYKNPN